MGFSAELEFAQEKMNGSLGVKNSFGVKNTFIEFSDLDLDHCNLTRQMSEPAAPLKRIVSQSRMETPQILEDPAGPEPEPETKGPETQEEEVLDVPWERTVTDERWAQPQMPTMAAVPAALLTAPEATPRAEWASLGGMMMPAAYGMAPYPSNGYMPHYNCMTPRGQEMSMSHNPAAGKGLEKRRRRRAGGSLIDLAKKRMEERLAEEAVARTTGVAAPASTAGSQQKFCGTCQISCPPAFRFCHYCGKSVC